MFRFCIFDLMLSSLLIVVIFMIWLLYCKANSTECHALIHRRDL